MNCRNFIGAFSRAGFAVSVGLFGFTVTFGQGDRTGTVEGRVQNIVTGRFLRDAQVSIQNTTLISLTDEYGTYRILNVPAGAVTLEFLYSGLDRQSITVNIPPGGTVTQDAKLTNVTLYGSPGTTVQLDPFTVVSSRETDATAIAVNEQRFAPNIKNVVSTDTHGEVMGGNLCEFLKFIPGVMTGAGSFEPDSVAIRGFPSNTTVFTNDGAPVANSVGASRSFTLEQVSINNISRVEVTKVPTPATGADSLAGSVNMVSKSAFERTGGQLRYNLYLTANESAIEIERHADPYERKMHRMVPGVTLDYTLPISKNLGIVLAATHFQTYVAQNFANRTFNATAAGTGASFNRPFLLSFQVQDSPQYRTRESGSARVDWRVRPKLVLSAGTQSSFFRMRSGNYNFNASAGANATPTVVGGTPFSFGDDFTVGATGRGSVAQSAGFNTRCQSLVAGDVRVRFDDGTWNVDGLLTTSLGKSWTRSGTEGHFTGFTTAPKVPVRVTFRDINNIGPGTTEVFTNTNQRFDIYDINNFDLTTASTNFDDRRAGMDAGHLNLKRSFNHFSFPFALQTGGARKRSTLWQVTQNETYTYNGVNGNRSAAAFAARIYVDQSLPMISSVERSSGKIPAYASPHYGYAAFKNNPSLFSKTTAQAVADAKSRANAILFEETVDAYYLQAELRLFKNRLRLLTGVRFEETTDVGEGPLLDPDGAFLRNPDRTFVRNTSGARVRKPEAGLAGSLEEVPFTNQIRAAHSKRSYDGYYPSLHLTYNATEDFLARLAYARTYGRPNFNLIIPTSTIDENDTGDVNAPNFIPGTITVRNTGLLPWTADNYDLSLEYYPRKGGLFGASLFHKEITDFFGVLARSATAADLEALGLPGQYVGWQLNTTINSGDASVTGFELSANQSLHGLTSWGQYFQVFANTTKLKLKGNREADFGGFLPMTANLGITFKRKPFIVMAKWNWRAERRTTPDATSGPDGYNYNSSETHLDVNIDYQFRANMAFYINAQNLFNVPSELMRYGSATPEYAKVITTRNYGAIFTAGINGTF